ncbi:MAG: hypothetical protein NVSMB6_20020 [Burkholderiaceae bacterium]
MKIVTYRNDEAEVRTGVLIDERILDVSNWVDRLPRSEAACQHDAGAGMNDCASGMLRLLRAPNSAMAELARHTREVAPAGGARYDRLEAVHLYAPVPRPGKIIGVGRNYADHAKETGVAPFEKPRIIFKMPSSVNPPGAAVARPAGVVNLDFEAELAVVIGGYGTQVAQVDALGLVAGYTKHK